VAVVAVVAVVAAVVVNINGTYASQAKKPGFYRICGLSRSIVAKKPGFRSPARKSYC